MSRALTLTLRPQIAAPVDMAALGPDGLSSIAPDALSALTLYHAGRAVELGELFQVTGTDRECVVLAGETRWLFNVGAHMGAGSVRIEGDCGPYCAKQMRAGKLHVEGDADDYAGAGMHGGLLRIGGNAGNFLGAAVTGDKLGMRGGSIWVTGGAGDRAGDRMRRGLILIEGDVGDYCASRMVAGTICALKNVGENTAVGMRRGSLIVTRLPLGLAATFNDQGEHELGFLRLLGAQLSEFTAESLTFSFATRARRFVGDQAWRGLGEILVCTP